MASVRKTDPDDKPTRADSSARTSPAGPAGLCPACGSPLPPSTGKRPTQFCSKACAQRTRRAQKASTGFTKSAGSSGTKVPGQRAGSRPTTTQGRLGTTGETAVPQVRGGTAGGRKPKDQVSELAGRDRRFTLREGLSAITRDKGLKGCGRSVIAGGVTPMMLGNVAYLAGVATCGKVHLCPCCGAKIRSARTIELQAAGSAWECQRCGLAMMTLTLRHYERHSLKQLVDWQREAWSISFGHNARKAWKNEIKPGFGIEGYVRAWECTHGGENGWHPHYHVLFFARKPWPVRQAEEFETIAYDLWSAALGKVGAYLPNREHGVDVVVAGKGTADALARYLMKFQDGAAWSIAAEMTRQDNKQGKAGAAHAVPDRRGLPSHGRRGRPGAVAPVRGRRARDQGPVLVSGAAQAARRPGRAGRAHGRGDRGGRAQRRTARADPGGDLVPAHRAPPGPVAGAAEGGGEQGTAGRPAADPGVGTGLGPGRSSPPVLGASDQQK